MRRTPVRTRCRGLNEVYGGSVPRARWNRAGWLERSHLSRGLGRGHVLVVIGAEAAPVIVDPFAGGVSVGAERLAALIEAFAGTGRAVTHVAAMPNRAILVRLLQNQASRAEQAGKGRRALELYVRMTKMAPAYPHAWWERARLELVDHEIAAARGSLGAMLEITREPELRRRVTEALEALPTS